MPHQPRDFRYVRIQPIPDLNHVVEVRLNRAEKKNAMSFAMMRELIQAAEYLSRQRQLRAVVLTGAGDDFCAGIDLGDLAKPSQQAFALWQLIKPGQSLFQQVCLVWRELPIPVLVVIQGHCLGAGLQLALAADVRFASPDARFAVMESKWGLVADMGLTQSAFGVVPADTLKALAMTADIIDGKQAYAYQLVTQLSDDPLRDASQLAYRISQRSPDAVLASKRIVNAMLKQSACTLYQEKYWQLKLILGKNRPLAIKKAKDASVAFAKRQFR